MWLSINASNASGVYRINRPILVAAIFPLCVNSHNLRSETESVSAASLAVINLGIFRMILFGSQQEKPFMTRCVIARKSNQLLLVCLDCIGSHYVALVTPFPFLLRDITIGFARELTPRLRRVMPDCNLFYGLLRHRRKYRLYCR